MLFGFPSRFETDPVSGRPRAPIRWTHDLAAIWVLRCLAILPIAIAFGMFGFGGSQHFWPQMSIALVLIVLSEVSAFALRRRKRELEAAGQDFAERLSRALD